MTVMTLDQRLEAAMKRHQLALEKQSGGASQAAGSHKFKHYLDMADASAASAAATTSAVTAASASAATATALAVTAVATTTAGMEQSAVAAVAPAQPLPKVPSITLPAQQPLMTAASTTIASASLCAEQLRDVQFKAAYGMPTPTAPALSASQQQPAMQPHMLQQSASQQQPAMQPHMLQQSASMLQQSITQQQAVPCHNVTDHSTCLATCTTEAGLTDQQRSMGMVSSSSTSCAGKLSAGNSTASIHAGVQQCAMLLPHTMPVEAVGAQQVLQLHYLAAQQHRNVSSASIRSSGSVGGVQPPADGVNQASTAPGKVPGPGIQDRLSQLQDESSLDQSNFVIPNSDPAVLDEAAAAAGMETGHSMQGWSAAASYPAAAAPAPGKLLQVLTKGQQAKKRSSGGIRVPAVSADLPAAARKQLGSQITGNHNHSKVFVMNEHLCPTSVIRDDHRDQGVVPHARAAHSHAGCMYCHGTDASKPSSAAVQQRHKEKQHGSSRRLSAAAISNADELLPHASFARQCVASHMSHLSHKVDDHDHSVAHDRYLQQLQSHCVELEEEPQVGLEHLQHQVGVCSHQHPAQSPARCSGWNAQEARAPPRLHAHIPTDINLCNQHHQSCQDFDSTFHVSLPTALKPDAVQRSDMPTLIDPYSFIWDEEESACGLSASKQHHAEFVPAVSMAPLRKRDSIQEACTGSRPSEVRMAQLVEELTRSQQACQTVAAEQQVLVVERSATIMHVQAILATVSADITAPSHMGPIGRVQPQSRHAAPANRVASCKAAAQRVAMLCEQLPPDSHVRTLLSTSELLPCLKELLGAVQSSHTRWQSHSTSLQQDQQQLQHKLQQTLKELEVAQSTALAAQEQLAGSRQRHEEMAQQLQAQAQQQQHHQQRSYDEAVQLRQRALKAEEHAAALQTQLQVLHQQCTQQAADAQAEAQAAKDAGAEALQKAEAHVAQALQQQAAEHQLQILNLQAELHAARAAADAANTTIAKQEQEHKERAQAAHNAHMQAARLNDKLTQQVATLQEQKLQLQVVVSAAEEQLKSLRSDVDRVRGRQQVPTSPRSPSSHLQAACGCSSPKHPSAGNASPRGNGLWLPPGVYHEPSFSSRPCSPPARAAVNPHLRLHPSVAGKRRGPKQRSWRPS